MDKLTKLISLCKCSVNLTVNLHRDYHETVEEHFNDNPIFEDYLHDIEKDVFDKMKELDTIIDLQFYPMNSVGSYQIHHYDLDQAITIALNNI